MLLYYPLTNYSRMRIFDYKPICVQRTNYHQHIHNRTVETEIQRHYNYQIMRNCRQLQFLCATSISPIYSNKSFFRISNGK
jgi:hypothetical protein